MLCSLRAVGLAALCAVALPSVRPVFAEGTAPTTDLFSSQLQTALNSGRSEDFDALLAADLQPELAARYQRFSQDFPDVSWRVESGQPLADGRPTLLVRISGEARSDGLTYRLDAEERIAIRLEAGRLVEQELLMQNSLLRSGEKPLQVTMDIPDSVLTGSRYDVDLIVDQPLGRAMLAGGLVQLTAKQLSDQIHPNVSLAPLAGGGLFKSVQAPQRPGSQTWALMLVHPDGVVTATKLVQVVSSMPPRARI